MSKLYKGIRKTMTKITVQDFMTKDLFEDDVEEKKNELLELLDFTRLNGVPLTDHQVRAFMILNENGLSDLANYANGVRPMVTPTSKYMKLIDKLTLADRIKGNAKLGKLLENQNNPAGAVNAQELQPKAMKMSELK
jgi:hypothetical protein